MSQNIFSYSVAKGSSCTDSDAILYPIMKVFLSRQEPPETEKSNFSYIGLLNETCDSKETVLSVLGILYDKMEIGKYRRHLVVVGDGKTFAYISDLHADYPSELSLFCASYDW